MTLTRRKLLLVPSGCLPLEFLSANRTLGRQTPSGASQPGTVLGRSGDGDSFSHMSPRKKGKEPFLKLLSSLPLIALSLDLCFIITHVRLSPHWVWGIIEQCWGWINLRPYSAVMSATSAQFASRDLLLLTRYVKSKHFEVSQSQIPEKSPRL